LSDTDDFFISHRLTHCAFRVQRWPIKGQEASIYFATEINTGVLAIAAMTQPDRAVVCR
jgi:hypothetical protein